MDSQNVSDPERVNDFGTYETGIPHIYFLKYFVTFGTLGSFITIYFNPALFTNEQGNTS